jgi:CubicO group peptidase (beta-lactamase class C family)
MMTTDDFARAGLSTERLARIGDCFRPYVDGGKIPGYVATIWRRGVQAHIERYGFASVEDRRPMDFDSIFRVMSMTKIATAAAAMILYEEGRFSLNDPISDFIPAFADARVLCSDGSGAPSFERLSRPVTFRHLFTHTAGLSYDGNPDDPVDRAYVALRAAAGIAPARETLADFADAIARAPLAFQPGTKFRYGFSTNVLGRLVEIMSGMPFGRFMQERIFAPLGMVDTGFSVPAEKANRLVSLYSQDGDGLPLRRIESSADSGFLREPTLVNPGGGLVSTIGDWSRFLRILANGGEVDGVRVLGPRTVDLFSMNLAPPEALPFSIGGAGDSFHRGYGFSLSTRVLMDVSESGQAGSVGEFGWDGAYCTHCWVDPKEEMFGIFMTQLAPFNRYPLAMKFKQLAYQSIVG